MSKPDILSDSYVKQWSIVCRFCSVLAFLPVPVTFSLFLFKVISFGALASLTATQLLLVAISVMFQIRHALLLEHQAIHKAQLNKEDKST